jgi:eukaryotic-like serine/threonine-protein kinase
MDEIITLEKLASQFIDEHRRWLNPSIEAYQANYSHLSKQIEELFPVLLAMEQWKGMNENSINDQPSMIGESIGNCKLIREIGRGGMSVAYTARQEQLGREVVVKILPSHFRNEVRIRERFEREVRTRARLQHRNIVSVYNFGESRKYCYYVMQLVQGAGLDWVISRLDNFENNIQPEEILFALNPHPRSHKQCLEINKAHTARELGRESWRCFAGMILQATKAIRYAHDQGTLHNNIKPSNILLDQDGHVWITDFGLAQYLRNESAHVEQGFESMLRYMPPERFRSISDERSDLYSIGAVLYELCTLTPMIDTDLPNQIIDSILNREVVRPREINSLIPVDLEMIILKSISKQPEERYSSAKEMETDLLRFVSSKSA